METLKAQLAGFNIEDAMDRFQGNRGLLLKYVGMMLNDFHTRLPDVRSQIRAGNFVHASQCLHGLCGSAAALSADYLLGMCRACEASALELNTDASLHYLGQIEDYLACLKQQGFKGG